jgi:ubiquinone/menaquinone biosynthesis C-methylase UbiE
MDGFYAFQFLHAAVEFDLFTLLGKDGLTREEIVEALQIAEHPARILLLGCVSLGLIRKEGDRYICSEVAAATLAADSPWDQRSLVRFGHEICYRPMWWFCEALRNGTNAGLREFAGTSPTLYGRLATNPATERSFHEMMGTVTTIVAEQFVEVPDMSKGGRLLDVGGGAATNAIALARRWPALEITIFDLPSVSARAQEAIEAAGLRGRVETMSGDCFADEFPTCDFILFAHFLEIWSGEQIRELLAKAHRALVPGGKIYLINLFQEDDESGPTSAAIASAYFLTLASGRGMAYTPNEYNRWLRDAGFSVLRRMPLTAAHSLIIATRDVH